jgi:hypothetical protein
LSVFQLKHGLAALFFVTVLVSVSIAVVLALLIAMSKS